MKIESFTPYLIKRLMAEGYGEKTVPEAKKLEAECDTLLTYSDGFTFKMACVIDREKAKARGFQMPFEELLAIGKACLKYAGKVNSAQMPIYLQVIEVGPASGEDQQRLQPLRTGVFSKAHISSWILDPSTSSVWTNAPANLRWWMRRKFQKMMAEPRLSDEEMFKPPVLVRENPGPPLLTYGMLALLAAVFIAEQVFHVGPPSTGLLSPSLQTLIAMGASGRDLVAVHGQWFRLFTSIFLHSGLIHLALNGIAFYFGGIVLEALVGRAWMFAIFILSGLAGSVLSIAANPPELVSVGASGAIMGMMAAAYVFASRLPRGAARTQIQMRLMGVLIPSLLPFLNHVPGEHVDFSAHLGGAVIGLFLGLAVYRAWPKENPLPGLMGLARAAAFAGLALCLVAGFLQARVYDQMSQVSALVIPDDQMPNSDKEGAARSADLVARYPHDPRALYFRAEAFMDARQYPDAEKELRLALDEKVILSTYLDKRMEFSIRGVLAGLLADQKRWPEAKEVAKPVCEGDPDGKMGKYLKEHGFCD